MFAKIYLGDIMKILSLNLHCFKEDNRIEKLNKIINFIKEKEIDLCIFQEAAQEITQNKILGNIKTGNNAYYIGKNLNYNVYFHPIKIGFEILEEGLAFVSKYPINNPQFKTISKTKDFSTWHKRDYLSANINGITFYNVHLGWDIAGEIGINQINNLLNETNKNQELIFLCGDFNYPDDSKEINYIKQKYFSVSDLVNLKSLDNPTFHFSLDNNLNKSNKMIDFIFTNKKIYIKKFQIVFNTESEYVSDHNGLFLEI